VHILIVDDEVPVATMLAEAIAQQGHEATVAYRGAEALALWGLRRPDAVLLDLRMPGMSGLDLLRAIRAADPDLPVAVITGHASLEEREAAQRLGVEDVIEKPFGLNHLGDALADLAFQRNGQHAEALRQEPPPSLPATKAAPASGAAARRWSRPWALPRRSNLA